MSISILYDTKEALIFTELIPDMGWVKDGIYIYKYMYVYIYIYIYLYIFIYVYIIYIYIYIIYIYILHTSVFHCVAWCLNKFTSTILLNETIHEQF